MLSCTAVRRSSIELPPEVASNTRSNLAKVPSAGVFNDTPKARSNRASTSTPTSAPSPTPDSDLTKAGVSSSPSSAAPLGNPPSRSKSNSSPVVRLTEARKGNSTRRARPSTGSSSMKTLMLANSDSGRPKAAAMAVGNWSTVSGSRLVRMASRSANRSENSRKSEIDPLMTGKAVSRSGASSDVSASAKSSRAVATSPKSAFDTCLS